MSLPIVDAVTAILVHEGEIFMTRRHPAMMAFPGYQAFPGGKVDKEDADGAVFEAPLLAALDRRLTTGLVRELREELGFDLVAAAAAGDIENIVVCARAITPTAFPRRFDTWFYRVELRRRPDFVVDEREAIDSAWAAPSVWLAQWTAGELIVAPPTLACLKALTADLRYGGIMEFERAEQSVDPADPADPTARDNERISAMQSVNGLRHIFVRSNTLPPAEHTNCYVIGDAGSPCIALDPSPRDHAELERLDRTLTSLGVTQILITHHHIDHNQFADELARRHGWPVSMSTVTETRLRKRLPQFFDDIELRLCREGEVLTQWLGSPVRVIEVPGHDDGQLALMPDNRAWFIVGDLIQGVGTVVISRPEGNMAQYFATLERVIALAPRFIFPSHGIGMGTTLRLEETLNHRRQREAQVLKMQQAGQSIDEMLAAIYRDVDPRLMPYAKRNIESHLDKLRDEGRITS